MAVSRGERNLSRMCDGAWWIDQDGSWSWLSEKTGKPLQEKAEALAQVVATICLLHLDEGVELVLRVGSQMMVCNVHSDGVRVGWRERGGNSLVLSTVLSHAELKSSTTRALSHSPNEGLPELEAPDSSSLIAETAVEQVGSEAPPKPARSPDSWSRERVTATVVDLMGGERNVENVQLGDPEEDGLEFEIYYEEDDDPQGQITPRPEQKPTREHTPPNPESQQVMYWMDFERIVEHLTDLGSRELGKKVVQNYWSVCLQSEPELAGLIRFEREEGIRFVEVNDEVNSLEASRILSVIERWLARCERVLPRETRLWRQMVAEELDMFWVETQDHL